MSIQSDRWAWEQAIKLWRIEPSSGCVVRGGGLSCGLSSLAGNLRVSEEFKIFTNVNRVLIDRKALDERSFVSVQADSVGMPPNSFAWARSTEYCCIPRDVLTICVGKRTYARCGIASKRSAIRAGAGGIRNTGNLQRPLPARVYANEGLCQIP
jgi:dCTP deaminase